MASVAGKYFRFKWNDKFIKCQGDVTFSVTNNFDEEEGCKPSDANDDSMFIERTLSSQDWSISVNTKVFLDALNGAELTVFDITEANAQGVVNGEGEFCTTPGQNHGGANNVVITGDMVISSASIDALLSGRATSTIEFLGNGAYTQTLIPVTT